MAQAPLTIKLRCTSWKQLANIYRRDLTRSALFLKSTKKLPPIGAGVRVNLTLPSDTLIILNGQVSEHVGEGGLGGRGPGVDIKLSSIPQSAMWLIESALSSVEKEGSQVAPLARSSSERAKKHSRSPQPEVRKRAPGPATPAEDASLDDGADIVAAEDELVTALTKELASLRKLNAFQMLGVGYETTDEAVRAAFGALTKRYHPDRFARYQSIAARDLASEIFILIRDAYRKVGDARNRSRTLAVLHNERPTPAPAPRRRAPTSPPVASPPARRRAPSSPPVAERTPGPTPRTPGTPPRTPGTPPRTPGTPPRTPAARQRPSTPQILVPARPGSSTGDRSTSELPVILPPATAAVATSATAGSGIDRANALLDEGRYEDAAAIFRLATRRDPKNNKARAGLELAEGLRSMAQRDRLEAAQRFEAVLELDPTNERAARELAEMRRQATNDRKGLLSRLLGKGE